MTAYPAAPQPHARQPMPPWAQVLLSGLLWWLATVAITFATGNVNLVPTIILLGSFLIPMTFVVYAFGRADEVLTAQLIFTAFVYGGVLGVLGATVLESALPGQPSGLLSYLGVGLIEEAVKFVTLWALARRLSRYTVRDGMVLGAAVGLGFAALQSAGYAFTAIFTSSDLSLLTIVETEVQRGILMPFGHGLWTAILGGALFATAARSHRRRPRLSGSLVGWYLLMVLLHAFWDASSSLAHWLTLLLTRNPTQWTLIGWAQAPDATQAQVHLYTTVNWALLLLDTAVGVAILVVRWRRQPGSLPARTARGDAAGGGGQRDRAVGRDRLGANAFEQVTATLRSHRIRRLLPDARTRGGPGADLPADGGRNPRKEGPRRRGQPRGPLVRFAPNGWLDRVFEIGIVLKGLDGLLELVGGVLLLLVTPEDVNNIIRALTLHELSEDPRDLIASQLLHTADGLTGSGLLFGAAYLLAHGIVKVVLVVALLRNKLWAYPWMIAVLLLFIGYQAYRIVSTASASLVALTVVDFAILALTVREYQRQRTARRTQDGTL